MRIEHYMNMRNRNRNYFIRKVTLDMWTFDQGFSPSILWG